MAQRMEGEVNELVMAEVEVGQGSGSAPGETNQGHQADSNAHNGVSSEQTILMLRDAIVGAIQQRPNPPAVTPMLPIVTAMKNLKTPYFEGGADPIEADQWIRKLERNLETAMCPGHLKKKIGTYYLDKDAAEWWSSREEQLEQPITWELFKEEFGRKYFPPEAKLRLQREFLNLRQGDKTVREYESEFMRLRRHAMRGYTDEQSMITQFLGGVRPELESRLAVGTYGSLTELVEKAANVENGLNREKAARKELFLNREGKKGSRNQNQKGKGRDRAVFKTGGSSGVECYNCGRKGHRAADCWSKKVEVRKREIRCYKCQQPGHYSYNCPMKDPIPAIPVNTRPPAALPALEPQPKRPALGGRVYNLELAEGQNSGAGTSQGPISGK